MITRKIKAEEYRRVRQLSSLAFEYVARGIERPNDEMLAYITGEPERRQDIFWDSQWAAFEDDDRTMMSTFTVVPYRASFDGHDVSMMGIGGVATLPQFRRRGGIRACFEKALPDMYQQGAALSYLYPFSSAFYQKFGYELACERILCKLELCGMPNFEVDGTFHLLEPGVDLKEDIIRVCSAFQKRYNLMVLEEDIEYAWIDKAEPFLQREYTYLYRSAGGEPKGVVTYKPVVHEGDKALDCDYRFYFTDPEGFMALIHLLRRLMADHSHVLISLPTDVELGGILPEWSKHITRSVLSNGMVRVINAREVLKLARMRRSGELIIELSDDFIAENNGRFLVRFQDGQTLAVESTQQEADIVLTIREFSRLICGRYDVSDFAWLPSVKMNCEPEKAAKVFYRKPMHICRYF